MPLAPDSDRARPLIWSPSATAAACVGPVVKARSIGNNCGGTAPERTRWRVVESELGFNESWGWFTVSVA